MEYYLIRSKTDDVGSCNEALYYGKLGEIRHSYYKQKIPKEHYDILHLYIDDLNDFLDKEEIKDYVENYF